MFNPNLIQYIDELSWYQGDAKFAASSDNNQPETEATDNSQQNILRNELLEENKEESKEGKEESKEGKD
jgi:hypothetical protein